MATTTQPIEQIKGVQQKDKVALQRLHETVTGLPEEDIAEYLEATRKSPELVESESNPLWFLRVADDDMEAAASRLARYWKQRKKSFGEKAFLPVTDLSGAGPLTADDVAHLKSGAFTALENDDSGKPVIMHDLQQKVKPDKEAGIRLLFYLSAVMAPNAQSQVPGIVCVRMDGSENGSKFSEFQSSVAVMKTLNDTMPMRVHVYHYCVVMKEAARRNMFLKHFSKTPVFRSLPRELNCSLHFHVKESTKLLLEDLVPYGLQSTGLPPSVGGTWAYSGDVKMFEKKQSADSERKPKASTRPESSLDGPEHPPPKRVKSSGDGPKSTNDEGDIDSSSSVCLKALSELRQERKCSIRDMLGHPTMRSRVCSLLKEASTLSLPQCKDRLGSVLDGKDATHTAPALVAASKEAIDTALALASKKATNAAPPANRKQSVSDLREACRKAALRNKLLQLMLSGANKASKEQVSSPPVERSQAQQATLRSQLISRVLERCKNP